MWFIWKYLYFHPLPLLYTEFLLGTDSLSAHQQTSALPSGLQKSVQLSVIPNLSFISSCLISANGVLQSYNHKSKCEILFNLSYLEFTELFYLMHFSSILNILSHYPSKYCLSINCSITSFWNPNKIFYTFSILCSIFFCTNLFPIFNFFAFLRNYILSNILRSFFQFINFLFSCF